MNRHYYLSQDLNDLEKVEQDLINSDITASQIHVYSPRATSAEVEAHELHEIADFNRSNVIHSGLKGALWGAACAALILAVAHVAGWTSSAAGWMPFVFLAIVIFGFTTWEWGLQGIQAPNHKLERFQTAIREGKHILFVDINDRQENSLARVVAKHPGLTFIGDGRATPGWLVESQNQFVRFVKAMP